MARPLPTFFSFPFSSLVSFHGFLHRTVSRLLYRPTMPVYNVLMFRQFLIGILPGYWSAR